MFGIGRFVIQGHDRKGWNDEDIETVEDFNAMIRYLKRCGHGNTYFCTEHDVVETLTHRELGLLEVA